MKQCRKCQEIKEYCKFGKYSQSKDGVYSRCKVCVTEDKKISYRKDPQKYIKKVKDRRLLTFKPKPKKTHNPNYKREYYLNNKKNWQKPITPERREKARIRGAKYRKSQKLIKYQKEYYNQNRTLLNTKKRIYKKQNSGKIAAINAERRAKKIQATVGNYRSTMKIIYQTIQGLSKQYNIDHIIPLINDDVCGLHVPWNLQILTATDNRIKGNKFDGTYSNYSWKLSSINSISNSSFNLIDITFIKLPLRSQLFHQIYNNPFIHSR